MVFATSLADAQHEINGEEIYPTNLLVVSLGKAFNKIPSIFMWQKGGSLWSSNVYRSRRPSLTKDLQIEREHERMNELVICFSQRRPFERKNYSRKIEKHENFHKLLNSIKNSINKWLGLAVLRTSYLSSSLKWSHESLISSLESSRVISPKRLKSSGVFFLPRFESFQHFIVIV